MGAANAVSDAVREPYALGPMPAGRLVTVVDERHVRAPLDRIFALAKDVAHWPDHLSHYRFVRFRSRTRDGGGLVEMSANRPFGILNWRTWWMSEMAVREPSRAMPPGIRFRHVEGITRGMDVEWSFSPETGGTRVRIVHVWNGPAWPVVGSVIARSIIGPVFVSGIASRTLGGLAAAAERTA